MKTTPRVSNPIVANPREQHGPTDTITTVVLPAYNEALALPEVLASLTATLAQCEPYQIVVVDDGSTDATSTVASGYRCTLIRHPTNRGKGAALQTGFSNARGRYIIAMDADASYPAEAVPRIVELLADNDFVRCCRQRNAKNMPLLNWIGNLTFDLLLTRVLGLSGTDHLSGLYGFRREHLTALNLEAEGFDIEVEIGIKARSLGWRIATFPVAYQPRVGEKKLEPLRDGWRILNRMLALALLHNPVLMFIVPGLILMALSLMAALWLREGPLITPYFGLSINSFILASLGILAGFQLSVFGMAAGLYSIEVGHRPTGWLTRLSHRRNRLRAAAVACVMILIGTVRILQLVIDWSSAGAGAFTQTKTLVLSATSLVWGLQILSAALFISIFAGRLHAHAER